MGSTATLGMVHTLAGQGTAIPSVQQVLRSNRLYAHVGTMSTILGGPGSQGLGRKTARQSVWFRDRQFLLTFLPFTKE
jgi:hypothetical protein